MLQKIDIKSRKNKIENVERLKSQTNEQAQNLFRAQEKKTEVGEDQLNK